MDFTTILKPGRNCWRIRRAERASVLIDGEAYFDALYQAIRRARHDITILSWDIFSEMKLGALRGDARSLAQLLDDQLDRRPELRSYILNWDFTMLFAMSREWLPRYKFGWGTHPRLDFRMDSRHPMGASHHQKVAIFDRQLAFSGGLDITRGRWDTPQHKPNDPRRRRVDGTLGRPHHDVQIAVSGSAARALHDLARERWRRACNEVIPAIDDDSPSLWVDTMPLDFEDVDVAISRTLPAFDEYAGVNEVEQLYFDAIAAARDYIYLENQYYTSPLINDALIERLGQDDGPEIILNLSRETDGWLAQNSMDLIRIQLLDRLRRADIHHRLAIYYPFKQDAATSPINLHAKIMLCDDRFLRVGSSNLNNRSMGLDTECDIAIECAPDDERIKRRIRAVRDRMLAEHLNVSRQAVDTAMRQQDSFIGALQHLRGDPDRSLKPLQPELPSYTESVFTDVQLVDPMEEIDIDALVYHMLPQKHTRSTAHRIFSGLGALAVLLLLAAAWRYTPLADWLDVQQLTQGIDDIRQYPLAPLLLIFGFIVAGVLMVPVTLLIIASVIVFGPLIGFIYAMSGALSCAVAGYALGSMIGRDTLNGLAGGRIQDISRQLARRGIFTIIIVRIVPVAPFTVINMVAGASHIRLKDFVLGTLIGLLPALTGISLLTDRVNATLNNPQPDTIGWLIIAAVLILAAGLLLSRYFLRLRDTADH